MSLAQKLSQSKRVNSIKIYVLNTIKTLFSKQLFPLHWGWQGEMKNEILQ